MTNPERELALSKLSDKEWRLKFLYSCKSKAGGERLRFVPNRAQEKLFQVLSKHKRVIILKARQLGITTGCALWCLDETLFHRNINALTIMQTRDDSIGAFEEKVQFAWRAMDENLKKELGWEVSTDRANQLTFGFGKDATSTYAVSNSGRSGTFQVAHISELAYVDAHWPQSSKEIVTGTIPAVPQNGTVIIESTANGNDGSFATIWHDAVEGKNGYFPLFFSWQSDEEEIEKTPLVNLSEIPTYFAELQAKHQLSDKEVSFIYSKWQALGNDFALLKQEYPTTPEEAFMSSEERLFETKAVDEYLTHAEDGTSRGSTTIYRQPQPSRLYVIGADPSEGVGADHSAATVWEIDGARPTVVASFKNNKTPPEDFAYILKELGTLYNKAIIAVERNNHGHAVIAILRRIYDEELIYRQKDSSQAIQNESAKLGFVTTSASKPLILHGLAQSVREFSVAIPSRDILKEMRMMPRGEVLRTRSDELTRHYDLLMATAVGYYARDFALEHGNRGTTQAKTTINSQASDIFSAL